MRTLRLTCAYDGTEYSGFQRQKNARSVQAELEKALTTVLGDVRRFAGAGRTDAGVHAAGQVISFVTNNEMPCRTICRAANSLLDEDIRVIDAVEEKEGFHARFSAIGKCYRYEICNKPVQDVFRRRYAWHVPQALDVAAMAEACNHLVGRHDFAAFQAAGSPRCDTVRLLSKLELAANDGYITLTAVADGFLYKMVRNIVGLLVYVGKGRMASGDIPDLMASGDRRRVPATAPAKGLTLVEVYYGNTL